jgi:YD repeat-containing protein
MWLKSKKQQRHDRNERRRKLGQALRQERLEDRLMLFVMAVADNDMVTHDHTLNATSVLANDMGTGLTASLVSGPSHGSVTAFNSNGTFTYVPNTLYAGTATGGNLFSSITTPNLAGFSYTFDANKNKTAEMITGALQPYGFSTGAGGYDNADRLVAWDRTDGNKNQSWTLTNVGDWGQFVDAGTQHSGTYNNVHELTARDGSAISFDLKGNLTANGVSGRSFNWDFDNHLAQTTLAGVTASYQYDAFGRRVAKTLAGRRRSLSR